MKPQRPSSPTGREDHLCSPGCCVPGRGNGRLIEVIAVGAIRRWDRVHERILRYRIAFTLAALALFVGGLAISFAAADLVWQNLALPQVLLILCVFAPMTMALAALSLQLTAAAVGRKIRFSTAFSATAIGNVAELLPLPGGAIVRGATLVRTGAALGESTRIITLTALLTLFMAIAISGIPLALVRPSVGYLVLVTGLVGAVFSLTPIVLRAGIMPALAMIGIRLLAMALGVLRFMVAFDAIGAALDPVDAAVFVVCAALASTMTLVPAGLGVTETLAATVAAAVDISPAVAFVAVAINRILGLVGSAIAAGAAVLLAKDRTI